VLDYEAGERTPSSEIQRDIAADIASGASYGHEEHCGVWTDSGDGCTCKLTDAVLEGLLMYRLVSLTKELGWDRATGRGETVVTEDFNPMPSTKGVKIENSQSNEEAFGFEPRW
jgi:hypothetical protein